MRRILVILIAIVAICSLATMLSCGGKSEQIQISYSGGNIGYSFHHTYSTTYNQINVKANSFTSEGHHLTGFFTKDGIQYFDENGEQLPDILIEKDIYVIAHEAPNEFVFKFEYENGTLEGIDNDFVRVTYGQESLAKFPSVATTNPKYELDGWFDGETRYTNGTELDLESLNSLGVLGRLNHNDEITLTARYKLREHTVTLDFNDGVTERVQIKVGHGESIGDLSSYHKDDGTREITGWSAISYGKIDIPEIIVEDRTIFAVWTEYREVTFNCGELGEVVKKVHMVPGESTVLPVYVIPGYKATAWYINSAFSGNPVEKVPYGAVGTKYFGKFEKTDYQITFITKTDEVVDSIRYSYGDKIDLPVLTQKDHIFLGWKKENDGKLYSQISTKDWGNITLTAEWLHSLAIATPEDLEKIRENPSDNYHLTSDIDLGGNEWIPIPGLTGILDGNGYKISNFVLKYNETNTDVGFVEANSYKIQNLTLDNVQISFSVTNKQEFRLGILCVQNQGEIKNCKVTSSIIINGVRRNSISDFRVGGVCCNNQGSIIDTASHTELTLTIPNDSGFSGRIKLAGLVAVNDGEVKGCEATGRIVDIGNRREYSSTKLSIGGAISENNGRIENSFANMELSSAVIKDNTWDNVYIGGLVTVNNGDIIACYSKGNINIAYGRLSGAGVGGLCATSGGKIENCYSTAGIIANNLGENCSIGGLVGSCSGTITNSYSQNTELRYTVGCVGGLVGSPGEGLIKGSFTNYSRAFGKDANYSNCSFNATGTNEHDLFEVLKWDSTVWAIDGKLPRLNWEFVWIDIEVPENPDLIAPELPEMEPELP